MGDKVNNADEAQGLVMGYKLLVMGTTGDVARAPAFPS